MIRPEQTFETLEQLTETLAASIGCNERQADVASIYTKQSVRCKTNAGKRLVIMFNMTTADSDRVMEDHRHRQYAAVFAPQDVTVVRGDNWLMNLEDADLGKQVQRIIGGTFVFLKGEDAQASQEAADAEYRSALPTPQRPDLAREDYPAPPADTSQGLLVHWGPPSGSDTLASMDIDNAFIEAIESAGLGVGDGDEHRTEETIFYYYGPDAEAMLTAIRPVMAQLPVPPKSYVTLEADGQLLRREDLPATR